MSEDQQQDSGELTDQQQERLNSLRQMVRINIDGDWDEEMIKVAFGELEKFLGVGESGNGEEEKKGNARPGRRRGRK